MQVMNIEIEEKTDYTLSIIYRDDMTNLPVDITGYSANLQLRLIPGDFRELLELTDGNGILLGGASGSIDITFPASVTDCYLLPNPWIRASYDLILTSPAPQSKRTKILKGFVTINRSTTV